MKQIKIIYAVAIIALMAFGCKDEEISGRQLDFNFQVLNMNNEPVEVFKRGENILFRFEIINKSDHEIALDQDSFDTSEFLKLYYLDESEGKTRIEVGKPYETIFCHYQLGVAVPVKGRLKLEIPWVVGDGQYFPHFCILKKQDFLLPGKYQTGFETSFKFFHGEGEVSVERRAFNIEFVVTE